MSPKGREPMDIESYNRLRRKQTLIRQKDHWDKMITKTEKRLTWVKSKRFEVDSELKTLQDVITHLQI